MTERRRRKKLFYVWIALGVLALLVATVQIIGMALPVKHTATKTRELDATPEKVWEALVDVDSFPKWRKELNSVQKLSDDPSSWIEKSKFGDMPLKAIQSEPPSLLVTEIESGKLPFGGTWTYKLEPLGSKTRLTITEDGEVYSPFFRFMSRYVFGYSKTIETYLEQLERHLQEKR